MGGHGLSLKTKIGFGVCDIGGELFFAATSFWLLNFFTDTVGIAAGLAGVVIAIGKVWDAVTDPVLGYLSDRTSSRWGRRRPYLLFGSVPLFVAMVVMFTNPRLTSQWAMAAWALGAYCLLDAAFTVVNIPYNALTPELTQDYHERSTLNGYRFAFGIVGTLLGAGAALPIVNSLPDRSSGFTVMGAVFGAIMAVTAIITFLTLREPPQAPRAPSEGFFKGYLSVFRNKPYLIILAAYTVNLVFVSIIMGVAIYYFKYILGSEAMTTVGMLILLVTAMAFIPVSVLVSKRIGKKLVYGAGMAVYAVGLMALLLFGHRLGVPFSLAVLAFIGVGQGFTMAMPYAMAADAVEYDSLLTGKRREGIFFGMWTLGSKVGAALALGISGLVLGVSGYVAEAAQTPAAQLGIRSLVGPIPAVLCVLAIVLVVLYPITERRYAEILRQIGEMEQHAAASRGTGTAAAGRSRG